MNALAFRHGMKPASETTGKSVFNRAETDREDRMKRADNFLLITGTAAMLIFLLMPISSAQAPVSNSPAATPAASVDPKDPAAGNAADSRDTADVHEAVPDTQLQTQVQEALSRVPELSNDSVRVAALPDGLELSGSVITGRERQAAVRIAQSYARWRKVVDHIVVSGRNAAPPDTSKASHQANAQP
jgi:hypothetical protein